MRDPREGLTRAGMIRTGADFGRVNPRFRPVHDAAVGLIRGCAPTASVYAYGSVVTGQAHLGVSDVDLLTIGLSASEASRIGSDLSLEFGEICRSVEIGAAQAGDFVGHDDKEYGNQVFLRHYCVLLAGSGVLQPKRDFAGDRRAARGFNGDIAQHVPRWRNSLVSEGPDTVAQRMARKSLLAVAGLVSVHDQTWTTDRETGVHRWREIAPDQRIGLEQLLAWTVTAQGVAADTVAEVLDETVGAIVAAFSDLIGLWPDSTHDT